MVELAYTADLKSATFNGMWVQIPPLAPFGFVLVIPLCEKKACSSPVNGTGAQTLKIPARVEIIHAPHFMYIYIAQPCVLPPLYARKVKQRWQSAVIEIAVIKNCFLT